MSSSRSRPRCGNRRDGSSAAAHTPPGRRWGGRRCGRSGSTRARRASSSRPTSPSGQGHRDRGCIAQHELSLDPDQGVHPVGLAPGEPLPPLVGVQAVRARSSRPGKDTAASCAPVIVAGWNSRRVVGPDMGVTSRGDLKLGPAPAAANAARHQDCVDASPVC